MAGYKYDWKCPNCGTKLQLKMRVTQTKRKCPHCGNPVTPNEIDRQTAARKNANLIVNLIMVVIVLCVIFFCCKGGKWSSEQENSSGSNSASNSAQQTANVESNVSNEMMVPSEPQIFFDLSTLQNAVKTHFRALKNRDVETYMKTLSQKYMQEYEDLGQKVQIWEDKQIKIKKNARTVIQEMFDSWNQRYINKPMIFYESELTMYEKKINGNRATIEVVVSANGREIQLVKENNEWKLENFPL